ncbi:MAG TPA: hypothetical protein VNU01_07010 [Egibacteraceae bacterium]|nr:hypothetical protein [Egibacteraceae bacterium]
MAPPPQNVAADALLGLLLPLWQIAIAVCVVVVLIGSVRRLARRGPSRMTTALVVTGGAVLALAMIGWLLSG